MPVRPPRVRRSRALSTKAIYSVPTCGGDGTIDPVRPRVQTVSFSEKFASFFRSGVRRRGEAHHLFGRVAIVESDDDRIVAEVLGGVVNRVELFRDARGFAVKCTCRYMEFRETGCEHAWALILAAEEAGWTPGDRKSVV